MNKLKIFRIAWLLLGVFSLAFFLSRAVWGHSEELSIIPESLTVKSGSDLKVSVIGLVGSKTAVFRLTGMAGKYELGEFPISGDDFTQILKIPPEAPAGSYRLTVEGGGNSAKIVITIN